jgi:hypothetical protein
MRHPAEWTRSFNRTTLALIATDLDQEANRLRGELLELEKRLQVMRRLALLEIDGNRKFESGPEQEDGSRRVIRLAISLL